ncbi:hypothetical protein L596_005715 [Steinernema carpocapsae]|uniref:Uncharacterized protein n=1 Tax=Steinernema carpocapsae TaxID=34508 RepID=A0A4V6I8J6_STECR|nr:hypothetical protein L596_005715 [Steinernema carpocapsae]
MHDLTVDPRKFNHLKFVLLKIPNLRRLAIPIDQAQTSRLPALLLYMQKASIYRAHFCLRPDIVFLSLKILSRPITLSNGPAVY